MIIKTPEGTFKITFMVAAFRHDKRHSLRYGEFATFLGLTNSLRALVEGNVVEYVSLRIMREQMSTEPNPQLPMPEDSLDIL